MIIPLLHIDFRLPTSPVVSCSDASERGVGVVVARSLSEDGVEAFMRRLSAVPNLFRGLIGLVESCAGIGGARRGFELLGINPAIYLVSEIAEDAIRVLRHQWPDVVVLGAMEDVTYDTMKAHTSGCPLLRLVFHFGGTPCPGLCAWNPFAPGKQRATSERLLLEFKRITAVCRQVFSSCEVKECEENVASMDTDTCLWVSGQCGRRPYCLDMVDLVPQRRRRYYWADWEVRPRDGVEVEDRDHYVNVVLKPSEKLHVAKWIKPGWRVSPKLDAFPTLTRPCPVRTPRWKTPGVSRASGTALAAWRRDSHRRPPMHYERRLASLQVNHGE